MSNGLATEAEIKELEKQVAAEVEDCVEYADAAPKPVSARLRAACPRAVPAAARMPGFAAARCIGCVRPAAAAVRVLGGARYGTWHVRHP